MNPKTNLITRRTLLRGLGATLALPYLEIMGGSTIAADSGKLGCPAKSFKESTGPITELLA